MATEIVPVLLTDSQGSLVLHVPKDVAERLRTDKECLASLAHQVRLSAMLQAPSASPRPTAASPPGPLNLGMHIHSPAAHSAGPSAVEENSNRGISESQPELKHRLTLFLLATIKKHHSIYNTNKPAFYKRVYKDMLQRDHKCSAEQIRKKITNMLATYKRVKDRCQTTGEASISWDYYTIMDEIFGQSGVGGVPEGTVTSTPLSTPQPSAPELDPAVLTKKTATDGATGRKPASQAGSFFESYETHADRRTAVLESLVRPDLERFRRLKERRRRSFEKKVLTSLGQISKSLQEIAKGRQEIVKLLQNVQHT
ncbi:uncharacterized protein LOC125747263 [Brienomyrus brachyistius]|uniref:uncharacterized protein LOC125747263 n=1 Tax=Brienomyrus brachyistius TaxID=42636 RepID=UPI0020B2E4F8|nr:uncharacterized protein LOC125747263 [Brienomyrus brachyistius]